MGRIEKKSLKAVSITQEARGRSILLAIGISNYDEGIGFPKLKTCSHDAQEVYHTFKSSWQLNSDIARLNLLTSESKEKPSRGNIIKTLNQVVAGSTVEDNLYFYFSGHGHLLNGYDGDFYLVPEDTYSSDDPEALISFLKILKIIRNSPAKNKVIILNTCSSGSGIKEKTISSKKSRKISGEYLAEYLKDPKGVTVLTSTNSNQNAFSKSPEPRISLFTFYLLKALRGEPSALEDQFVTVSSLYDYLKSEIPIREKSYGLYQGSEIEINLSSDVAIADYSKSILSGSALEWKENPLHKIELSVSTGFYVKNILKNINTWSFQESYLENKVNDNLAGYFEDEFGEIIANLYNQIGFSQGSIGTDKNAIHFPNGSYFVNYKAVSKKSGLLKQSISFDPCWFDNPHEIPKIINCFSLFPDILKFHLAFDIVPRDLVQGLKAKGWNIISITDNKIIAKQKNITLTVVDNELMIEALSINEFFSDGNSEESILVSGLLVLLSA